MLVQIDRFYFKIKACVCSLDASAKYSYNILPQTGKPKVHAILVG